MITRASLAARCESATGPDNTLDVLIEIALFKPNSVYTAVRANNSGSKVIYTDHVGNDVTCWAEDWTISQYARDETAAILKAEK